MSADPSAETPTQTPADFADQMHEFWDKNHRQVYFLCAVIFLAIIGREGWAYLSTSREQGIEEDYARVAATPDKLAAFADEHSGHPLAGVALLRLADDKYTSGNFSAAVAAYAKAATVLTNVELKSRAQLGAAMSQFAAGDKAAATAALKALSADTAAAAQIRAEATYNLASLASEAGRTDEVRKYADEVIKLDASGAWAQRAYLLSARLPADKSAPAAGGITFKP